MKVIIDNDVFTAGSSSKVINTGRIVGVILSDQDKENIKNMHPECSIYICFPADLKDLDFQKEHIAKFVKDKYNG